MIIVVIKPPDINPLHEWQVMDLTEDGIVINGDDLIAAQRAKVINIVTAIRGRKGGPAIDLRQPDIYRYVVRIVSMLITHCDASCSEGWHISWAGTLVQVLRYVSDGYQRDELRAAIVTTGIQGDWHVDVLMLEVTLVIHRVGFHTGLVHKRDRLLQQANLTAICLESGLRTSTPGRTIIIYTLLIHSLSVKIAIKGVKQFGRERDSEYSPLQ